MNHLLGLIGIPFVLWATGALDRAPICCAQEKKNLAYDQPAATIPARLTELSAVLAAASFFQPVPIGSPAAVTEGFDLMHQGAQLARPLVDPKIIVSKSNRRLQLYSAGRVVRTYRVALGLSPVDDKVRAGDRRTPEGEFYIYLKNPKSRFYLSLGLSYPNRQHAERGVRDGLITRAQYDQIAGALERKRAPLQNTRLGGEIFIHGNGSQGDWTWGCIALDDNDIRELYDAVPVGTAVTIEH